MKHHNNYSHLQKRINKNSLLAAVVIFVFLVSVFVGSSLRPDPFPTEIREYLQKEGYDMEDVEFIRVSKNRFFGTGVYRSSRPILYNDMMTSIWKIYSTNFIVGAKYVVVPAE